MMLKDILEQLIKDSPNDNVSVIRNGDHLELLSSFRRRKICFNPRKINEYSLNPKWLSKRKFSRIYSRLPLFCKTLQMFSIDQLNSLYLL